MKKIISIVTLIALILGLTACGSTYDTTTPPEPQPGPPPMPVSTDMPKEKTTSSINHNFENLKYYFTIDMDENKLKMPATLNDCLTAGFINAYGGFVEDQKFISNATASARLKNPDGNEMVVHLSNPSDIDIDLKDAIVAGITLNLGTELSKESIKIYPSVTNATQKYLSSKITIEDAEIVLGLGEYAELKDFKEDHTQGTYIYGVGEQKYSVTFTYNEEQFIDKVTIYCLNLLPQNMIE